MPYKIRKLPNKDLYRVYNTQTGHVHAKGTTLEKAKRMIRLLNAVDHGWKPAKRPEFWPSWMPWPISSRKIKIVSEEETLPPLYILSDGSRIRGELPSKTK